MERERQREREKERERQFSDAPLTHTERGSDACLYRHIYGHACPCIPYTYSHGHMYTHS